MGAKQAPADSDDVRFRRGQNKVYNVDNENTAKVLVHISRGKLVMDKWLLCASEHLTKVYCDSNCLTPNSANLGKTVN